MTPPFRNSQQPQLKTHQYYHQGDLDRFGQIRYETTVSNPWYQHQNSNEIEDPKKSWFDIVVVLRIDWTNRKRCLFRIFLPLVDHELIVPRLNNILWLRILQLLPIEFSIHISEDVVNRLHLLQIEVLTNSMIPVKINQLQFLTTT